MYRLIEVIIYLVILLIAFRCVSQGQPTHMDIVASTLILEAGGEYHEGSMQAVHEVIVNRSHQRKLASWEVCLQRKQFSCWNSGKINKLVAKAKRHPRWREAMAIIQSPLTNYAKGADHYHADYCDPYWNKHMKVTAKIGRHIFYK